MLIKETLQKITKLAIIMKDKIWFVLFILGCINMVLSILTNNTPAFWGWLCATLYSFLLWMKKNE